MLESQQLPEAKGQLKSCTCRDLYLQLFDLTGSRKLLALLFVDDHWSSGQGSKTLQAALRCYFFVLLTSRILQFCIFNKVYKACSHLFVRNFNLEITKTTSDLYS